MIVLDTNVISELFRPLPNPRVVAWLESLSGEVAITAITAAELLVGVRRLPGGRRQTQLAQGVEAVLDQYRRLNAVLPFDVAAASHYAELVANRKASGSPISMADAEIAAICRTHLATCATRNVKDFQGTGVSTINPWEA
ncbi:type II toxin-antitoxin system VapC family toxin [Brevibacterium gallinarum]|uniref:Ribonuclease VapC n=1 Tax=Brevibacterium gallinarum TaxID=2762220 RepID=A0ABR8WVP4_9MICO|nr:type II toxin-antitoxin system VapC family toxin [Brevibacterium gallinarum]MBD8021155.1 type II toxin-antitoxin system VapC family toxin [Brevibacterium gallinarum]